MIAKVCLIEDDPIMGESLYERLLLEGFACDWHRTGAAALERIGQEPYAAVVSDIRLPDGSGETIFRRAIERNAHAPPFVFVTAYGAIDRAVELLKLGAADYVTKPFDVERLIAKLRVLAGEDDLAKIVVLQRQRLDGCHEGGHLLASPFESGGGQGHAAAATNRAVAAKRPAVISGRWRTSGQR
jgi:DNA-binding response OmpR family regulator